MDEVLGAEPLPISKVPGLLARAFPAWKPYRDLNGTTLRAILAADHGIKVASTGNRYPLDPATIRDALAARPDPGNASDAEDDGDEQGPELLAS